MSLMTLPWIIKGDGLKISSISFIARLAEVNKLNWSGQIWSHCTFRQVSKSANHRKARMIGMKQYSPPRVTTNRGRFWKLFRTGLLGAINFPTPSSAPAMGSLSLPEPIKTPLFTHYAWTNSTWRRRCAPMKTKIIPLPLHRHPMRRPGKAGRHSETAQLWQLPPPNAKWG